MEYRGYKRVYWHRALIKRVDINLDTVHVLLVDWGINVIVPTNKIRPLQKHLTKIESQVRKLHFILINFKQSIFLGSLS